jgi:6-phosphogluconolactonase
LDKSTGALTHRAETTDAGESPSYIALTPNHEFMIVANEVDGDAGGLTSLAIAADGSLTRVNHVKGSDGGFTYVGIDPSGKFAMGASYNGGSTSIFPIAEDGTLGEQLDNMDFGASAQTHCIGFAPEGGFAFVANKGNNEVAMLEIAEDGTLSSNPAMPVVPSDQGAGPRHIAVRADGKLAFVINELGSSMTPYTIADGILTKGTSVSSLPADFNGQSTGGHVELSPDGRFVYGSNRGHDSIVVFEADASNGALTLLEHEATRGQTPRDFEVDPAGDVLIVANQDSTNLAVFSIEDDGTLSPLGEPISGPPQPCAVQVLYLN